MGGFAHATAVKQKREERSNTTFDSKIRYYILLPLELTAKLPGPTEVS